ncbi:hypothetical protein BH10PSE7_BH10PSE7_34070 [soil metagenome]
MTDERDYQSEERFKQTCQTLRVAASRMAEIGFSVEEIGDAFLATTAQLVVGRGPKFKERALRMLAGLGDIVENCPDSDNPGPIIN